MSTLADELREERHRNLEDTIRHARWEAEIARRLGRKWFEMRDNWLIQAYEADREMWKDPKVREALIKAILARNRKSRRSASSLHTTKRHAA